MRYYITNLRSWELEKSWWGTRDDITWWRFWWWNLCFREDFSGFLLAVTTPSECKLWWAAQWENRTNSNRVCSHLFWMKHMILSCCINLSRCILWGWYAMLRWATSCIGGCERCCNFFLRAAQWSCLVWAWVVVLHPISCYNTWLLTTVVVLCEFSWRILSVFGLPFNSLQWCLQGWLNVCRLYHMWGGSSLL